MNTFSEVQDTALVFAVSFGIQPMMGGQLFIVFFTVHSLFIHFQFVFMVHALLFHSPRHLLWSRVSSRFHCADTHAVTAEGPASALRPVPDSEVRRGPGQYLDL